MKITQEHYDYMLDAIAAVASRVAIADHRAAIVAEGRAQDVDKRVRWDYSHAAGLSAWICDNIYNGYDGRMNDSHIDTALRAIMRELEH